MFAIGLFFQAIARVIDIVLVLFMWIIIARAVLSWVNPDPFNPIVRFIHNVTEPILYPIRTKVPVNFGGIDFSPIIVFLGIVFLRTFVVNTLFELGKQLSGVMV